MEESIKFYNQLELTSHNKSNLIILGKNTEVNPYNLIENSDIVIGLHSSLVEYAWFIGKTIVTYCDGILTNSTIYSIDFNNNSEFYSTLDTLTSIDIPEPNNNLEKLQSRLLYIVLGYYGFDRSWRY